MQLGKTVTDICSNLQWQRQQNKQTVADLQTQIMQLGKTVTDICSNLQWQQQQNKQTVADTTTR